MLLRCGIYPLDAWKSGEGVTFRKLKLHCLTHFRRQFNLPYVAYNAFWSILKWLFQNVHPVFLFLKCTTQGGTKADVLFIAFFTIVVEISGGCWQIVDPSGKKIILLSSLLPGNCDPLAPPCYASASKILVWTFWYILLLCESPTFTWILCEYLVQFLTTDLKQNKRNSNKKSRQISSYSKR